MYIPPVTGGILSFGLEEGIRWLNASDWPTAISCSNVTYRAESQVVPRSLNKAVNWLMWQLQLLLSMQILVNGDTQSDPMLSQARRELAELECMKRIIIRSSDVPRIMKMASLSLSFYFYIIKQRSCKYVTSISLQ